MGFAEGVKAGLCRTFASWELEFGVRARRLDFGEESGAVAINGNLSSVNLDLSKTSAIGVYMGYNILF